LQFTLSFGLDTKILALILRPRDWRPRPWPECRGRDWGQCYEVYWPRLRPRIKVNILALISRSRPKVYLHYY